MGLLPKPYSLFNADDAAEMAVDMSVPKADGLLRMSDLHVSPSPFLARFSRLMVRHQSNRADARPVRRLRCCPLPLPRSRALFWQHAD